MVASGFSFVTEVMLAILFLAFLAAVLIGMWRNSIETQGLLSNELHGQLSMHRMQLLTVTFAFAVSYCLAALALGPGHPMPDVPTPLLGILIGSHATYLAGKRHHLRRLKQSGR